MSEALDFVLRYANPDTSTQQLIANPSFNQHLSKTIRTTFDLINGLGLALNEEAAGVFGESKKLFIALATCKWS